MKLPLITLHARRLFHVLQFDDIWAIGVFENSHSIERISFDELVVLPEHEYEAWKRKKDNN